ncbi:thiamine pyrophosphate-dependent enzyme [Streptomyces sp. NPDC056682]|uniref:thiamine pyrophosphate-dependent enzyme n=1 Tax=Streptomyces sp. NPDC056682 TaxID=3345909 RepID=UPI0036B139F5
MSIRPPTARTPRLKKITGRCQLLGLTGLAIGQGIPVATGAAIACPERPVVCLQADGSALYTISGLWTQAREKLNVTTVILNNRSYAILRAELDRVGGGQAGPAANALFDLSQPNIDFTAVATAWASPRPGLQAQPNRPNNSPPRWPHPDRASSRQSSSRPEHRRD